MTDRTEMVDELLEIKNAIEEKIGEAEVVLRDIGGIISRRAESYWIAHIKGALDKGGGYLGGSMCTMQDTINELENGEEEEE